MKEKAKQWIRVAWPAIAGLCATLAIWFAIPVPYIVYEPGPSSPTRPMVATPGAEEAEDGDEGMFLLTTVRWSYANLFKYAAAHFDPDAELFAKEDITRGASRTDYVRRQRLQMRSSHSGALEAVYRELGVPYGVRSEEIVVFSVLEGLSAEGVLRPGDRLLAIDGRRLASDEDVRAALADKRIGDAVQVTFLRQEGSGKDEEGARRTEEFVLRALPNTEPPRPGLGMTYGVLQTIESEDPAYRVDIRSGAIGGPSAGLMFALEIYDRFVPAHIAKGYTIAGTGEIAPDGTVGEIGGVAHKVAGAHSAGADLFLVPPGNYGAAREKAASIGSEMMIVPVASLREALDYLASLPDASTRTGGL